MKPDLPESPRVRRWPRRLAMALVAVLFVLGPWPVDDSGFEKSAYQGRTLDRLDAFAGAAPPGPIRVGLAEVDLTPGSPRPLAGFIGQVRTPFVGVDTPCLARALTVEATSGTLTILTADLLLINAKLARATCQRAGVRPDEVYFTSSHTHGGPGGWGDHPLEMLTAGAYDPAFFDELASKLADVVRRSRIDLEPAEVGFVQVQAKGRQSNRVIRGGSTHDALSALIFRPAGARDGTDPISTRLDDGTSPISGARDGTNPICVLTVFGAHATVSHPVPPRVGGDYPAALVSELKRRTGARSVLFAAGAVGDASPSRPKADSTAKSAQILGSNLADDLMAALPSARFETDIAVGNIRLDVDLPPVRLPFVARWLRFSPLATWWIADRRTHLHAVRLGPAVLVGFPGDYAGHLADRLVESTRSDSPSIVATSFDGDYRGYLVAGSVFREIPTYETRWMSFYGPWSGEYLNDLARRMVDRLAGFPEKSTRPILATSDLVPRVVLAILLAGGLFIGLAGLGELAKRAGWVTLVIASTALLAYEVAPNSVDWARFGLPMPVRMAGIPLGLYALAISPGNRPRAALPFVVACALLSASWIVVLMIARGWVRSGFGGKNVG